MSGCRSQRRNVTLILKRVALVSMVRQSAESLGEDPRSGLLLESFVFHGDRFVLVRQSMITVRTIERYGSEAQLISLAFHGNSQSPSDPPICRLRTSRTTTTISCSSLGTTSIHRRSPTGQIQRCQTLPTRMTVQTRSRTKHPSTAVPTPTTHTRVRITSMKETQADQLSATMAPFPIRPAKGLAVGTVESAESSSRSAYPAGEIGTRADLTRGYYWDHHRVT